jgi:parallel beta-helix repeat protein
LATLFHPPTTAPVIAGESQPLAKRYFYQAGTTTPITVYTTSDLDVAHSSPVQADSDGVFAPVYFNEAVVTSYRTQLTTADDELIDDYDDVPVPAGTAGLVADVIEEIYPRTAKEITGGITPTDYSYPAGDVRRYGVVGDGVTDDTEALNDACAGAGTWGQVYIDPSLNCLITDSVVNSTLAAYAIGQRWYGGGKITTQNSFDHHVFDLVGITDFTVEGLRGVSGTLGAAYSSATARFFNAVSSSHRCKLIRSHITGFQSAARFNASEHCQAIGNDIISPYGWGVNVQTDAHDCIVRDNRISGTVNEHGIYVAGSTGDLIRGAVVDSNTVTGSTIDGIKLSFCDHTKVTGNHSYSNSGQGIYCTLEVEQPALIGNSCVSNGENGILLFTTVDRAKLIGNTCRLNDKNGISANTSVTRAIIAMNHVEDNDVEASGTQYGILVTGTGSDRNKVVNNYISDEVIGVNIAAGSYNEIAGNTAENCSTVYSTSGSTQTKVNGGLEGSVSWNPGDLSNGTGETTSLTVTGAAVGDRVEVFPGIDLDGLVHSGYVSATDTVELRLHNGTGGNVNLASSTWRVRVVARVA